MIFKKYSQRKRWLGVVAWVMAIVLLTGGLMLHGAAQKKPFQATYTEMKRAGEWEAVVNKVLADGEKQSGRHAGMDASSYPTLFEPIYQLGPEAVPYLLERVEQSEANGWHECFLMTAAYNNLNLLILDEKFGDFPDVAEEAMALLDEDIAFFSPKHLATNLRLMLKYAPRWVDEVCESNDSLEHKLERLDALGLAPLPYLAERIKRGETEWTAYFERQMVFAPVEVQFEANYAVAEALHTGEIPVKNWRSGKYAMRQKISAKTPALDVDAWISQNDVTLQAIKYACEGM